MHLSEFPRVRVAHLPTPIEFLERLTGELGGPEIWIKRDDCTGLSTGGNKTRKLEFLLAEALEQRVDTVITAGATQSNHARQTAAFAAKLGIECHILLEDRTGSRSFNYNENGNVLLDRLHGATIERRPGGVDMSVELEALAARLSRDGRVVYTIPAGGSNPTGALGYANCALEILHQTSQSGIQIDQILHATGSAGTQAGLLAGLRANGARIPVLGIGVRVARLKQEDNVFALAAATSRRLGVPDVVQRDDVVANTDYVGEAYGVPTESGIEAIRMFAQLEGILLDPVYTGKCAAGLVDLIRKGQLQKGQRVLFLHTGGSAGLFAYDSAFTSHDGAKPGEPLSSSV